MLFLILLAFKITINHYLLAVEITAQVHVCETKQYCAHLDPQSLP